MVVFVDAVKGHPANYLKPDHPQGVDCKLLGARSKDGCLRCARPLKTRSQVVLSAARALAAFWPPRLSLFGLTS